MLSCCNNTVSRYLMVMLCHVMSHDVTLRYMSFQCVGWNALCYISTVYIVYTCVCVDVGAYMVLDRCIHYNYANAWRYWRQECS